jgi:PAS domain-containing protein
MRPLDWGAGLIFDGRSVMVSLCSLYFGPEASVVATLMALAQRLRIGGVGLLMGSLVILSSAGIGLLWRRSFRPDNRPPTALQLYVFGLLVHAAMIALMATLPSGTSGETLRRVGFPVMLLYPLATILAGKILSDQVAARRTFAALRQSEERFVLSMEATRDGLWDLDVPSGRVYYSPACYRILGYEPGEFPATNESWSRALHPDDAEQVLESDKACIDGKTETIDVNTGCGPRTETGGGSAPGQSAWSGTGTAGRSAWWEPTWTSRSGRKRRSG